MNNLPLELLVTIFFGWFGAHKFMEKKIFMGIVYLFTMGLFGIGWFIDIFIVLVKMGNRSVPNTIVVAPSTQRYDKSPNATVYINKVFPESTEFPQKSYRKVDPKSVVCEYCDESNDSKNIKCSNCGASLVSNY